MISLYLMRFYPVQMELTVQFSHHNQNPPLKTCEFLAFAFISSSNVDIPSASPLSARFLAIFLFIFLDTLGQTGNQGLTPV